MVIRLACLDMAGTTVSDDGAVEQAFTAAIATMGIDTGSGDYEPALTVVRETMGRSKIEVFRLIFGEGECSDYSESGVREGLRRVDRLGERFRHCLVRKKTKSWPFARTASGSA